MKKDEKSFKSVNEYINSFSPLLQKKLKQIRKLIKSTVPEAKEKISYQMPAYDLYGILVYFGGYEKHIGFYPTSSGIEKFKDKLKVYKSGKGSIQFPLDKPLPEDLIKEIVIFRKEENIAKDTNKKKKSKEKNL
jgi:uncharacterized protein YdhG (YjbR/CyaY superfamily)